MCGRLLKPDIVAGEFQQDIIAGKAREDPFTVPFPQIVKRKICGNDSRFPVTQPDINTMIQLGRSKAVIEFRAQVVYDQKIAVQNI